MDITNLNYIRVGCVSPEVKIGDVDTNAENILKLIKEANNKRIQILTFPELSLTGYTCQDLFNQSIIQEKVTESLKHILTSTCNINMLFVIGAPIQHDNQLFNCAVVCYKGFILGVVPKTHIPNYNEFYEKRWFVSSNNAITDSIILCGQKTYFGKNLIIKDMYLKENVAVEICEDAWVPNPPSVQHSLNGANIILNLSASNEIIGKEKYREKLIKQLSASCINAYVYCSAGISESTTDTIFSGDCIIAENGNILKQTLFKEDEIIYSDIDLEMLQNDRQKMNSYMGNVTKNEYHKEEICLNHIDYKLERNVNTHPFVPKSSSVTNNRCDRILKMQSIGLSQRLKKINCNKLVIGVSGGLDSTLALLVAKNVMNELKLDSKNIIGITMPGFGTTDKTYNNSLKLMKELDVTIREISIKDACLQHFKDIGQSEQTYDITYENCQARERTQILMDVANKENAIVVGTGDLSEIALGWCTYNADHMSMYNVNSGVPKTLVKYIVKYYADNYGCHDILKDILNTEISPELLPPDENGNIQQKTESKIGPYELHDFFLYNMIRFGYSPKKIFVLAIIGFQDVYTLKEIKKWMLVFYKRFFQNQFKRDCVPNGVKIGSISLSPRADWRMPSDACYNIWINEINNIPEDDDEQWLGIQKTNKMLWRKAK